MKRIIYGLLLGTAVTFSACDTDDFLLEEPKLKQSSETLFDNYDDITKAIIGAYAPLSCSDWYGGDFIAYCEMRAGNARKPADAAHDSGRLKVPYDLSFSENSTMSGLWSYAYRIIANANNVIDNVDGKADAELTNPVKGEALFLRALCHFDLVRTFAQPYTQTDPNTELGVPVVLHTVNGSPARDVVAKVYEQIVADLLEAETLFPAEYNTEDVYHSEVLDYTAVASKEACQALLSRAYLYMGEWQKCADYATKVINSGRYAMWDKDKYPTVWTLVAGDTEVIFEVCGNDGQDRFGEQGWEFIQHLSCGTGASGGDLGAANDIVNMYADDDVRKQLYVNTPATPNQYWTLKYAGKNDKVPAYNNIIVLRLSEMYLNRAEAIIRGASVAGATAADDMKTVASSRGTTAMPATLDGVFDERRKELAFEGHVIYDFARCGKSIKRVDCDATIKEVAFPNKLFALPIPYSERNANPNIVQNQGW